MRFINYLKTKTPVLAVLGLVFTITSCGSYQSASHDSDGIYGSSNTSTEQNKEVATTKEEKAPESNYYKNYFKEKANEIDSVVEENEVFTDIDSYKGEYDEENSEEAEYNGYAGWGQESDNVTINVYNGYNSYWNRPYYGWNSWYHRPYYGGFGWNYGFGSSLWCESYYPYYGYGYGYASAYPYYRPGYYNRNGYRRGMAYNYGRRGDTRMASTNRTSRRVKSRTTRSRKANTSTPRPRRSTNTSSPRPRRTNTSTPRPRRSNTSTPRPRRTNTSTPRPRRSSTSTSSSPRRSSSMSSSRKSSSKRR